MVAWINEKTLERFNALRKMVDEAYEQGVMDGKARVYAPGEVRRWGKEVTVTCKSPEVYL